MTLMWSNLNQSWFYSSPAVHVKAIAAVWAHWDSHVCEMTAFGPRH